jgi:hypothetical protein
MTDSDAVVQSFGELVEAHVSSWQFVREPARLSPFVAVRSAKDVRDMRRIGSRANENRTQRGGR